MTTPVCDGESVFRASCQPRRRQRARQGVRMAKSRSLVRNETTTAVQSSAKSLRLPADLAQQIDRWTKAMGEDSHSEAMRPLLGNGLSVADRSAPSPIAPVPQSDLRGVVTPKTGTDRLADQRPDGWAWRAVCNPMALSARGDWMDQFEERNAPGGHAGGLESIQQPAALSMTHAACHLPGGPTTSPATNSFGTPMDKPWRTQMQRNDFLSKFFYLSFTGG